MNKKRKVKKCIKKKTRQDGKADAIYEFSDFGRARIMQDLVSLRRLFKG